MDINLRKFKHLFLGSAILFLALLVIAFSCHVIPKNVAYADTGYIVYKNATYSPFDYEKWQNVSGIEAPSENAYYKDITVNYEINNSMGNLNYYQFGVSKNGGVEIMQDAYGINYEREEISYTIADEGTFDITLYVYDMGGKAVEKLIKTVKSDITPISDFAEISNMPQYLKGGYKYDIQIDTAKITDELSGIDSIYYQFDYIDENKQDIDLTKITGNHAACQIDNNGELTVWYFDNAGNFSRQSVIFDKFDSTAPLNPVFTVTPISDIEKANGYTKGYIVDIDYPDDEAGGSGLKDVLYYTVNNETFPYTGQFTLTETKNYTIKAKSIDNAGNISTDSIYEISVNNFDTLQPSVNNIKLSFDMRKELFGRIDFTGIDSQSGIDKAYIEGLEQTVFFTKTGTNLYSAEFKCFGLSNLTLHISDKAGNDKTAHIPLDYFDGEYGGNLERINSAYINLSTNAYNKNALEKLEDKFDLLNIYLISNTQNTDFDSIFNDIDAILKGSYNYGYVINTAPKIISANITYTLDSSDIADYKVGDEIRLEFTAEDASDIESYVENAGYKNGFGEKFGLYFYHNDELLDIFSKGVKIEMAMPSEYITRKVAIFDTENGKQLDISIYNSRVISFEVKSGGGEYILVIQGEKGKDTQKETKGIKIFDKTFSYGVFFGIVFGSIGCAAIAIAIITIVKKKQKKRG